jgi:hypothetical protein
MPYCTIVEFEWDETFDREAFAAALGEMDRDAVPVGRLSKIGGIDEKRARMIEVWRSSDDARAFAEKSTPSLSQSSIPPPSRVVGFEVTTYLVS